MDALQTLVEVIKKDMEELPAPNSSASIYKVPKELRAGNENYFTPRTMSIGPLHANSPSLVASKDVKTRYLKSFLSRLPEGVSLEDVIHRLHCLEGEARACYAEKISLSPIEFLRLMIIDGCFILQLLWKYENRKEKEGDPIFLKGRAKWAMLYNLQQDLLLLENQLPFIVLCSLYELIQKSNTPQALADSVIYFFDSVAPNEKLCRVTISTDNKQPMPKHLLDLVMLSLFPRPPPPPDPEALQGKNPPNPNEVKDLPEGDDNHATFNVDINNALLETLQGKNPPNPNEVQDLPEGDENYATYNVDINNALLETLQGKNPPNPNEVKDLPEGDENHATYNVDINNALLEIETHGEKFVDVRSASELELSGVKFAKCTKKAGYLTDITFCDGLLSIPTVVLLDSTASLFWNLLALEQCSDSEEYGCLVISYVSFMDNLICDNKDVEIFTRKGLLQSWVNDDNEFLVLFNRMALAADMDGVNKFSDISHQLESYCQSNIHPLRAYIVRNYFEARWDLMNTVMLFIFTVTQTLFAILGYYGKGK